MSRISPSAIIYRVETAGSNGGLWRAEIALTPDGRLASAGVVMPDEWTVAEEAEIALFETLAAYGREPDGARLEASFVMSLLPSESVSWALLEAALRRNGGAPEPAQAPLPEGESSPGVGLPLPASVAALLSLASARANHDAA